MKEKAGAFNLPHQKIRYRYLLGFASHSRMINSVQKYRYTPLIDGVHFLHCIADCFCLGSFPKNSAQGTTTIQQQTIVLVPKGVEFYVRRIKPISI